MEAAAIGTSEETVSGALSAQLEVRWLGRVRYNDALALQRALFASQGQYLLLLEHTATYTLGIRASETNFLTPVAQLQGNGIDVVKADRGGDVTYHGPGQLTGYPILSLPPKRGTGSGMVDTVAYVTAVEQLIIDTCADLGLPNVGRVARLTGVWVDPESAHPRKIAAIGVKLTRGRSMHGFALNVDSDCLEGFNHIVPCGISDKGVTSLVAEGINVSMRTVVDAVVKRAEQLWGPQSGLPVGRGPADGSRSEAELGPVSSTWGPQSGLPVGRGPADGSRSEAELGPVSSTWGTAGTSRADANWRVTPDDLAPFSKGAGPGSKAVARLEKAGVDTSTSVSISERKPEWLRVKANMGPAYMKLKKTVADLKLVTVCEEAGCPNIFDCWNDGTATFMILGERCTRACGFCLVDTRLPLAPDRAEPANVAKAVERMHLQHAVITMVARDDLADGGASAVAATVDAVHRRNPGCRVEVLISDHKGDPASLATVFGSQPEVLNHNLETVLRLQRAVRPSASYARSLSVLAQGKAAGLPTKSGIMVGLGETVDEVHQAMRDLRNVGVDILTIGQYLRPTSTHLPTARWWTPEEFDDLRAYGQSLGFAHVEASPLTRSSFHAKAGADAASVPTGPVAVTLSSTRR